MMNPKYQARKKIVAGMTNAFFLLISSRNSGDRSTACQSISERCSATKYPFQVAPQGGAYPTHARPTPEVTQPQAAGRLCLRALLGEQDHGRRGREGAGHDDPERGRGGLTPEARWLLRHRGDGGKRAVRTD